MVIHRWRTLLECKNSYVILGTSCENCGKIVHNQNSEKYTVFDAERVDHTLNEHGATQWEDFSLGKTTLTCTSGKTPTSFVITYFC